MKQVVGYIDVFVDELLTFHDIKLEDLIGSTFQLCFGKVVSETKLSIETSDDALDQIVHNNIGTCTEVNHDTKELKVMFASPMPLDVFNQYYNDKQPIFGDEG